MPRAQRLRDAGGSGGADATLPAGGRASRRQVVRGRRETGHLAGGKCGWASGRRGSEGGLPVFAADVGQRVGGGFPDAGWRMLAGE